eukprot:NODE_2786_length_2145_cov_17.978196.p4 GENE.NODE_2786_length_2145_cov_17.978196~~NODE_2786_length_2145_cov_17.978196.p4  ORF type:complete len:60 (+),score=5.01 NODE_2786_length_2145_cov_17.978196:258-437(+)
MLRLQLLLILELLVLCTEHGVETVEADAALIKTHFIMVTSASVLCATTSTPAPSDLKED